MPEYIDIHSHLNFSDYDQDREVVISRMKEKKVSTISVGTDLVSSGLAVDVAARYENVFACIGLHPRDNQLETFESDEYKKLVSHPKVVAIGECGLDYFRMQGDPVTEKRKQAEIFDRQIRFALDHNKPLMIHCRDAYDDVHAQLASYYREFGEKLRGNMHFFAGDSRVVRKFLDIGFTVSFTGVVTFARDYDEVLKFVPLNCLMAETDAPFVAPIPFRGKRNEPVYVIETVRKIAEIRGQEFETVKKALCENACRVFKLSFGN